MKKLRFFRCQHCGNIIVKIVDSKVPVMCCGEIMKELTPNTTDAAQEKHVPVVEKQGNGYLVKVGAVPHPMTEEHYIEWIEIITENATYKKFLKPGDKPEAYFDNIKENKFTVKEYCNLHGLYKADEE